MGEKRIAIVTPYGAEPRYDNYPEFILAESLIERGWRVRMYTYALRDIPMYRTDLVYKGIAVARCRHRFGISPKLFLSLLYSRPDVVLCYHPKNFLSYTARLAARVIGARFIVEVTGILHDPYIVDDVDDPEATLKKNPHLITDFVGFVKDALSEGVRRSWNNYVLHSPTGNADRIIAINEQEKKYIFEFYGRSAERIYCATPRARDEGQMRPTILPIPDNFLFFIGQIKRRKGWDTAIEGMVALRRMGHPAHLVFVTPQKDLAVPIARARARGVLSDITFLSAVSNEERQWLYSHARAVLVPSTYEGFGLPVFEAFLSGAPVCASDIPVFREFLSHKENAILFTVGSGEALARAVIELDSDPALREHLIEKGRQTAERFSYERMVEKHISVFS